MNVDPLAERPFAESLCAACAFARKIVFGKGSQFLLCEKSKSDGRFPKYPRQPVIHCQGFAEKQAPAKQSPTEQYPAEN
jgi:hypothetical protein